MNGKTNPPNRAHWSVRTLTWIALAAAVVLLTLAVTRAATDWLISNGGSGIHPTSLGERGQVGQTYNAATALFSGLALLGVAGAVVLQLRELRLQRQEMSMLRRYYNESCSALARSAENGYRASHFDLMRMAIENPALADVWPPYSTPQPQNEEQRAQFLYVNMILSHQWLGMKSDQVTEGQIRAMLRHTLKSPIVREFWTVVRTNRLAWAANPDRVIDELMDLEYQRARGSQGGSGTGT